MPLVALVATQLTSPVTRSLSIFIGGRDLTGDVKWDSLVITDSGSSAKGVANLHLTRPLSELPELTTQARLRMVAHADNEAEAYGGFVTAVRPRSVPGYSGVDVVAADIGGLLDDTWIPSEVRPAESLRARIGYLWGAYAPAPLSGDLSFVAAIGGTLPPQNFAGVTLRQAIEQTIGQASSTAAYYVDAVGRPHVFTAETNDAPFNIDADAPGVGEVAPHDLSIDWDEGSFANRVYVQGATPAGSGFFQDDAAIATANGLVRTAVLQAPDCETGAMALSLAQMYLGRVGRAIARGSFSVTSPDDGWRGGQNLLVTSADLGLSAASFRISQVTTTIIKPGSDLKRRYVVAFGGSRAGGSRGGSVSATGGGQVVSGQLGGASNVYVTSAGVAVTDGTTVRAEIGALGGGEYGLRITNAGATVIIDGTSNVFKIALTGTIAIASSTAAGETTTQDTFVTNLGGTNPVNLWYVDFGGSGQGAQLMPWFLLNSSGGAGLDGYYGRVYAFSATETRVRAYLWTSRAAGTTGRTYRYYVMREAAI